MTVESDKQRLDDFIGESNSMRKRLQKLLDSLEGRNYESIEDKKEVVRRINTLIAMTNSCVICITCGESATVDCYLPGTSKVGIFRFKHGSFGNHNVGGILPKLQLVPKDEV